MAKVEFGTKAGTLNALQKNLTVAEIPPFLSFTVRAWKNDKEAILSQIVQSLSADVLIIRSSAVIEDSLEESHAGEYSSFGMIPKANRMQLEEAICQVIAAYDPSNDDNEVLVQSQVRDIALSGVIFTRDLDTFAPYITINYDDLSGLSDSVTSGNGSHLKNFVYWRGATAPPKNRQLARLIELTEQLEGLLDSSALDIEFAIGVDDTIYLLQVRPIVSKNKTVLIDDTTFGHYLRKIYKKIQKLAAPHPGLSGRKAMFSVMTDWNPAEIIGVKPRALAASLYRELVTDSTWAYQRSSYGYKDLVSFPLMISFLGHPYIDVRASFNSFVPKDLDDKLTGKLVDYYIDSLSESPTDHDKVEFNIVFSCYYLNLPQRLKKLLHCGFSELELDRIKFSLLSLTNRIISEKEGLYKKDLERVHVLEKRFEDIKNTDLTITDKIYWLIEDCKRYGTLPFAGLARAGFIAVQFLRSFVDTGIMSEHDFMCYMNSLNTVAKKLAGDSKRYARQEVAEEDFLREYGHLRPGTYDILSPRYDEAVTRYFQTDKASTSEDEEMLFSFSAEQRQKINEKLIENGLLVSVDQLLEFLKVAIEGRESAKFLFTRNLSYVLVLLEELGKRHGFSREEMSFVDIKTVLDLYTNLTHFDVKDILAEDIRRNKEAYNVTKAFKLPQLITCPDDVYQFFVGEVEPNFITLSRVTSIIILEEEFQKCELTGKIALIRSADPGYDWIFSRQISGLVTMYGGANSHMAIRCAELKIPAVIGCGEQNFALWSTANMLDIDCVNKQVNIVNRR